MIPEDLDEIRKDFNFEGVFFDNAASTQKPFQVINGIAEFYKKEYANVHRGIYQLSEKATLKYEMSRKTIASFINSKPEEVIFTRNTTEGLNLISDVLIRHLLEKKKEVNVLLSEVEHHSNIVPWFIAKERYKNVNIDFIRLNKSTMELDEEDFENKIENADILSLTLSSNVLGTSQGDKFFKKARDVIKVADGAQFVPHNITDVKSLKVDFLTFSGHKMLGPTGIGVLYGKKEFLEVLPTYQGGGEMIREVSFKNYIATELPLKYEAGTPNFVGAYGLKLAIDYLNKIGMNHIQGYEKKLTEYMKEKLENVDSIKLINHNQTHPLFSFTHSRFHPHDVSALLDQKGIATRAGHHCAMPLHLVLGLNATVRASLYFYNTFDEIDYFVNVLKKI